MESIRVFFNYYWICLGVVFKKFFIKELEIKYKKIFILLKTYNFAGKSKFCSIIEIWFNNRTFGHKSKFQISLIWRIFFLAKFFELNKCWENLLPNPTPFLGYLKYFCNYFVSLRLQKKNKSLRQKIFYLYIWGPNL